MTSKQQKINVLKSWHAVEFFQPFDLYKRDSSIQLTHGELQRQANQILPWLSDDAKSKAHINSSRKYKYTLYLGIFDKNEITRASQLYLNSGTTTNEILTNEIEERVETEGQTCFAKLSLDDYGTPNFSELSVSTLPWALGHLKNNTLEKLSHQAFQNACDLLKEALDRIALKLNPHPLKEAKTLCADALIILIDTLYRWANFMPTGIENPNTANNIFAFQLDYTACKPASKVTQEVEKKPDEKIANASQALAIKSNELSVKSNAEATHEAEPAELPEGDSAFPVPSLPILNSFFIEDIEWAINKISGESSNRALNQYLSIRQKQDRKSDLYTPEGLKLINKNLQPQKIPMGRWPASLTHNTALMQQFAINTAIEELSDGGLLSVNGPPGTGKTTMLRDLIAHNVTQRAKILAGFENFEDSLDADGFPHETLRGFEMVIASSNNAAVQNISKELPQVNALADEFQKTEYLKSVANQLAAKENSTHEKDMKEPFKPLQPEEMCWGIIAATLGNKKNCDHFLERVFFKSHFKKNSEQEKNRPPEFDFLTLWRWKDLSCTVSFAQAKQDFTKQLEEINICINHFNHIFQLLQEISKYQTHKNLLDDVKGYIGYITKHKEASQPLQEIEKHISKITTQLEIELKSADMILAQKPGFLSRLLDQKKYKLHHYKITKTHLRIKKVQNHLLAVENLKSKLLKINNALIAYPDIYLPNDDIDIRDAKLQRNAPWQDSKINNMRSQLFIKALQLHESWLKQALKVEKFRVNIFNISALLSNPKKVKHHLALWHCLFMIVPVVGCVAIFSSTVKSCKPNFSGRNYPANP